MGKQHSRFVVGTSTFATIALIGAAVVAAQAVPASAATGTGTAGSPGVSSPPVDERASLSKTTLNDRQLEAALPRAADVPSGYRAVTDNEPPTAPRGAGTPDVCPATAALEGKSTQSWVLNVIPTRAGLTPTSGLVFLSTVWQYPRATAAKSGEQQLATMLACGGVTNVKQAGVKSVLNVQAKRLSSSRVIQNIRVTKRSNPKKASSYSSVHTFVSGRFVIRISADRIGGAANPSKASKAKDERTIAALATLTARRLAHPVSPNSTEAITAPRAADATGSAPQYIDLNTVTGRAGSGDPWTVSLGDSYISGEAGRWGANVETVANWWMVDKGSNSYNDGPQGMSEQIKGCHRSNSAEVHIGNGVKGLNLACSGATVNSTKVDGVWKPGIDYATEPGGTRRGQASMLEDFAKGNNVKTVLLSIGGNDFNFGDIVEGCVTGYIKSMVSFGLWGGHCKNDKKLAALVSAERAKVVAASIAGAEQNIRTAMRNAGYADDAWKLVVQNYPSPIPNGDGFRYYQNPLRWTSGGCGFWNDDATWANTTVLNRVNQTVSNAADQSGLTNILKLDLSKTLIGHRLCENGVTSFWVDRSEKNQMIEGEWVQSIVAASWLYSGWEKQESLHPNYWAQLAFRNCIRQVYDLQTGGQCERVGNDWNANKEPNTVLRH
ncbi:MAG: hypothetical protein WCP28_16140 [Actinomycetes bacterium]